MLDTQLALRGQLYATFCCKALFANPAAPKPPKQGGGYGTRGPLGTMILPPKESVRAEAAANVVVPPAPPPKLPVPVVPPRPLPALPEHKFILPKAMPPPPPPPSFPPLPPTLSYGPLQPPEFYPKRASHPYLKPKATTRYPFREVSRAT